MSIISAAEASAINDFVAILGCSTCVSVTGALACQANHVNCQLPGGYGLELASRNLSGRIDGGVWQRMRTCVRLSLERNALTGTLPPALLVRESPLRWLYLNDNTMSGSLPSMPASTQLEELLVVNNRYDGTIPAAYFSLPQIVRLHLSNNRFSGALPTPPVNTSQRLDNFLANRNQLTGTIGAEWQRLTRDKNLFFTAGSNRLSGTLPDLFANHTFTIFASRTTRWAARCHRRCRAQRCSTSSTCRKTSSPVRLWRRASPLAAPRYATCSIRAWSVHPALCAASACRPQPRARQRLRRLCLLLRPR
jgi:hypothetical protein